MPTYQKRKTKLKNQGKHDKKSGVWDWEKNDQLND